MSIYDDAINLDLPASGSYWKLDEASGNAADSGGGAHTGTATGMIYQGDGPIATEGSFAYGFNGAAASRVDAGDIFEFTGTQSYSIDFWMKPQDRTKNPHVVSQWTAAEGWNIRYLSTGLLRMQRFTASAADSISTGAAIPQNVWTYIGATYDGSNMNLYVNGVLSAGPTASAKSIGANAGTFQMSLAASGNEYAGFLSRVAVYPSVVLTSTQITNHYNAAFTTKTGWYTG